MKRSLGTVKNSIIVRKYHDQMQAAIDSGEVRREGWTKQFWAKLNGELVESGAISADEAARDLGEGADLCLAFHGEKHGELFLVDVNTEFDLEFDEMLTGTND